MSPPEKKTGRQRHHVLSSNWFSVTELVNTKINKPTLMQIWHKWSTE